LRARRSGPGGAIIAMAPAHTNAAVAMDMFRRLANVYDGPIVVQNAATYAPLNGEQIATLVEEIPQIEYVKEERPPGPKHIAEVHAWSVIGSRRSFADRPQVHAGRAATGREWLHACL